LSAHAARNRFDVAGVPLSFEVVLNAYNTRALLTRLKSLKYKLVTAQAPKGLLGQNTATLKPMLIPTSRHAQDASHHRNRVFIPVLKNELETLHF
jgi:hypothetical protein